MSLTQLELEQSLEQHRLEIESYLNTYINETVRHREITQTTLETEQQTVTVNREITYGDITVSALMIMLLTYTMARQIYTDIRSGI